MSPALRRRLREGVPSAVLAATIYIPLLLTKPGYVGADTKTYLYLDPSKMLARASSMWDPNIGMGTVTHQNIGYLWPIGPWYWAFQNAGVPDWVAQRLWLGTILFTAGLGVRFMLKALGQEGPHVTAATFVYALTPYVLTLAARLSVILLPYAGLPWLIGLTVLALRKGGWRHPALFALVVATIGSINATSLLLVGVAPVLWIFSEVVITRDAKFKDAAKVVGRIGVMTVGCSLWWIAGLWAQGGYGIEILRYTETAETVATASVSLEVLRGLGYWFFYGEDRYGPWIAPSRTFTTKVPVLFLSYVLPGLGLLGAAFTRFRDRAFFLLLLVIGLFLAVGAHPWDSPPPAGSAVKAFLQSDIGLSMRSLPRAAPLVVLSLSVFVGALVAAATKDRPNLARPATAGVMILAVLGLPPLWRGQFVDSNLDRKEDIPQYWNDAAAYLDSRNDGTRVLEVPGEDFASYRWGTTVDPVLPGIMDRPYVARELIPYGSPPSADLLNALDHRLQEGTFDTEALAPMARFMGVGDISVRSDLTYERYNTPRPRLLWNELSNAHDIGKAQGFGGTARNVPRSDLPLEDEQELLTPPSLADPPQVGILPVEDAEKIVRTASTQHPVVLAGDGDGIVDTASAGLLSGKELVQYAASLAGDQAAMDAALKDEGVLVLTDTNRRQARRWGTVRDNTGITERAGQKALIEDPKDQRLDLFTDAATAKAGPNRNLTDGKEGDGDATVTESRGGVWAEASSYGNSVTLTPEDNPVNAVDDDDNTAWRTGGFSSAKDEELVLHYRNTMTTDGLRVLQAQGGVRNRFIQSVDVRFDGGAPHHYVLTKASRDPKAGDDTPGQTLRFPKTSFKEVSITITATNPGQQRRYDGASAVGFASVVATDPDGVSPVADDVVRLPTDLLHDAGKASKAHELAVVLTRQRVSGTVAVRTDPEPSMARTFTLPTSRTFGLTGQVRLSNAATDQLLDEALGRKTRSDGGIDATSKRRLPGGLDNRASDAIDGDPGTWYSPGFLDQHGETISYTTPKTLRFDHLAITVLNDGRHSVPQTLDLFMDGTPVQKIQLPHIQDQPTPNGRYTFDVKLDKAVTGKKLQLQVPAEPLTTVRDVTTLDWFTGKDVVMPMGIVDIGVPGLKASKLPKVIDDSCRSDLVTVDGKPVSVSLHGTTADLLAGKAIDLTTCDGASVRLAAGTATLRTTPGGTTGFDLDRLVLRSAPGGAADRSTGHLVSAHTTSARPKVTVTGSTRSSTNVTVTGATKDFWLVLGQSHNAGWHATIGGKDLGEPVLVDGYANGWRIPASAAGKPLQIEMTWTPQRVVWGMIASSIVAVLAALLLIAWPRRAAVPEGDPTWVPLDARPAMPHGLHLQRILRYAGPTPSRFALLATVGGSLVLGGAIIGPIPGVFLAIVAAVALRIPRSRPVLTLGGPLLFAAAVAYLGIHQQLDHLPSGFDWPSYFEAVQQPAWTAVALLFLDAIVDRCWLRRWWPTDSSPT